MWNTEAEDSDQDKILPLGKEDRRNGGKMW